MNEMEMYAALSLKERAGYYAAQVAKYSALQRLENDRHAARSQGEKDAIEVEILAQLAVVVRPEDFVAVPVPEEDGGGGV